jgi:hypothetical protein
MTVNHPSLAAQRAIYTALNGNLTDPTTSGVVPVYDEPPENAAFPYVTIGPCITTPRNTFGRRGRQLIAQIDVWSRSGPDAAQDGWLEAKTIGGEIDALLDWTTPAASDGWNFVGCQFERSQEKREPDGITRSLVMEYRLWVETT